LSVLADEYKTKFDGFGIFGIIKETGVDDEGLIEFSKSYFDFPIYCDKGLSFYQALGDRRASDLPSLWSMVTGFFGTYTRIQEKGIGGNTKGEGLLKGGIILFDSKGKPKYAYEEETGEDLPVADIVTSVEAMQPQGQERNEPK